MSADLPTNIIVLTLYVIGDPIRKDARSAPNPSVIQAKPRLSWVTIINAA